MVIGHKMSAFIIDIWTELCDHAPFHSESPGFHMRPKETIRYVSRMRVRPHRLLITSSP